MKQNINQCQIANYTPYHENNNCSVWDCHYDHYFTDVIAMWSSGIVMSYKLIFASEYWPYILIPCSLGFALCKNSDSCDSFTHILQGCHTYTNVLWALQNYLAKLHNAKNHIYGENFKLKICTCAQSMGLGRCTKFQLEILIKSMISPVHKFWYNNLESWWYVCQTTHWCQWNDH